MGVQHLLTERPGLVAHAARVPVGAPVALRPVVAYDRVGGGHAVNDGRQPVTELCKRVNGIACVNADLFNCKTCGQPAGGLVDKGRPLRSFRPDIAQVSVVNDQLTTLPIAWSGRLSGQAGSMTIDLPVSSLNRGPMPGGVVLYTPEWGPTTPQIRGQLEVVLASGGPLQPGAQDVAPVARRPVSGAIPRDGIVLAANGRSAQTLNQFWDAWRSTAGPRRLTISTALNYPASLSIGAHPVLLKDGVRQPLNKVDGFVTLHHPRTLLGWTKAGDLLLVTIDGRQKGYSEGATLEQARNLMLELGAWNAVNLDGGGSTTFATQCLLGACVQNRPSDGGQRPVPMALALVPAAPGRPAIAEARAPVAPAPVPSVATTTTSTSTSTTSTTVTVPARREVAFAAEPIVERDEDRAWSLVAVAVQLGALLAVGVRLWARRRTR